jgi:hypothetical protein
MVDEQPPPYAPVLDPTTSTPLLPLCSSRVASQCPSYIHIALHNFEFTILGDELLSCRQVHGLTSSRWHFAARYNNPFSAFVSVVCLLWAVHMSRPASFTSDNNRTKHMYLAYTKHMLNHLIALPMIPTMMNDPAELGNVTSSLLQPTAQSPP